jgi:hypothetical protein
MDQLALLDLPLEILTGICHPLDLRDLVRVAATYKRLRHGDNGLLPTLVEGIGGLCHITSSCGHSLAVTQSGAIYRWGGSPQREDPDALMPVTVEGFNAVRVRLTYAAMDVAFRIGEAGEHFVGVRPVWASRPWR